MQHIDVLVDRCMNTLRETVRRILKINKIKPFISKFLQNLQLGNPERKMKQFLQPIV